MSGRKDTITAYSNQYITDAFVFDDQEDFELIQQKDYSFEQKKIIEQEDNYQVVDSDDDLMITPQDKAIIFANGDDLEFQSYKCLQSYDLKKDIKIDSDNLGAKNL